MSEANHSVMNEVNHSEKLVENDASVHTPRSHNIKKYGVCSCECECYLSHGYATLAPIKIKNSNDTICRHFASCSLSFTNCKNK